VTKAVAVAVAVAVAIAVAAAVAVAVAAAVAVAVAGQYHDNNEVYHYTLKASLALFVSMCRSLNRL
jgi:hypothetical protein